MASVMCLHFSMQEEDILEHTNAKCHCVHFSQLVDRPLSNIGMHLIIVLNIVLPRY
jgi:hypothetical protein